MPHAAFSGQTPDEMYFGTAANLPVELVAARSRAQVARLAANRAMSCNRCLGPQPDPAESRIPPMIPALMLLRTREYGMSPYAAGLGVARTRPL